MSKDQTLIIYHGGFTRNASTISEHVKSFVTFIDTPIILLDTAFIFSNKYFEEIEKHNITNIILHYSLFGYAPFRITQELVKFITNSNANKIAFFQDELIFSSVQRPLSSWTLFLPVVSWEHQLPGASRLGTQLDVDN